jgi:hypothetical protein
VLVLDPMHMQYGLMSKTFATLGPVTLKMGNWHYKSKIFCERIIFVKAVPLYSCRSVIHLYAYCHYIPTLGLLARGEYYWRSLLFETKPPLVGLVSSTPLFLSKVIIFHAAFLFVSVGKCHRNMNHIKLCQFIYTNNEIKEDYFNPRFEHLWVLLLDPMHMQCGHETGRET